MGHGHHHGDPSEIGERRLWWAVSANILLTVAQVIGGILSGSLSLVADALHNFSDAAFDRDQIAVEVGGKTYYGCCPMCKDRLNQDASIRKATDPISGAEVDKAAAIIGADESGKVYYFETEENLHKHMGH